jgi:hypothetical protein
MEFAGPDAADFANVRALNGAFLELARRRRLTRASLNGLEEKLAGRLQGLTENQASRLAAAPFLLFSFRERDARLWEQLLQAAGNRDLFTIASAAGDELARLTAAGLGFVWQLAQRNPYAARVLAGASLHWCEQIAERTFLQLLAITSIRDDLLQLRSGSDSDLWRKLLDAGVMRDDRLRQCAHVSALQAILTHDRIDIRQAWPAAARKIDRPGLRVAEESTDG